MTRLYSNNFSTTLDGAITDVATSMTLTSVTGFPAVGSGDTCQVTLDDGAGNVEIVTATAIAGSVITITRAQEGTSGFAFADLDPVEIRETALTFTDVLAADLTPYLAGPLDSRDTYIGFGASSTSTAYCINHAGNIPKLIGAANYYWGFTTSSNIYAQAGTSWNSIKFTNDSTRFVLTTNNSERLSVNDSGTQFGASGARITTVLDEDAMGSDSATALATQQSIKAYVDASAGGAPEGTAVLSTGEVGGTKYLREDGDGTCSWQTVSGSGIAAVVDDTTPQLGGELELNGNYIDFGGSSSATAYNIVSSGGVPQMTGAANYKYTFTSSSLVMNAGTSWYSIVMANTAGMTVTTNNVVRIQANNSGVQFGAAGARINSVLDEDTMSSNSATDLATQQSIKAYVDSEKAINATSISFDSGTNVMSEYEAGTFTPTFDFATTGDLSVSYVTQGGTYLRIGDLVIVKLSLVFTPTFTTASGDMWFEGLPFACDGSWTGQVQSIEQEFTHDSGYTYLFPLISNTKTYMRLRQFGSGQNSIQMDTTNLSSGTQTSILLTIAYTV